MSINCCLHVFFDALRYFMGVDVCAGVVSLNFAKLYVFDAFSSGGVSEVMVLLLLYGWLLIIQTHILSSPERDKVDGLLLFSFYISYFRSLAKSWWLCGLSIVWLVMSTLLSHRPLNNVSFLS